MMQRLKVGSLFSGIGGFDLGLERAGFEIAWQSEIDPYCLKVLEKHWPRVKRYGDIREMRGDDLEPVDLICGGFPCQPFSCAGKRGGQTDDRYLWPEMLRIITEVRPRWVIGENVPGIINLALDQVLSDLEDAGYACQSFIIPACGVGALHRRDRVWIVGYSNCNREKRNKPQYWQWSRIKQNGKNVANANGTRELQSQGSIQNLRGRISNGSQNVADTDCEQANQQLLRPEESCEQRWNTFGTREEATRQEDRQTSNYHITRLRKNVPDRGGPLRGNGELPAVTEAERGGGNHRGRTAQYEPGEWWSTEPGVGFSNDGLSPRLDGGGLNAEAKEGRPGEVLSGLWGKAGEEILQRQIRGLGGFQTQEVLQSGLHGTGICQRCAIKVGAIETGGQVPWEQLRNMWGYGEHTQASHRRELIKRFAREYSDLMRQLSYYPPPPCSTCWSDGSWEDGIPRVAMGVPNRVDRLRALGNAVVPQIPELFGRAIREIEEGMGDVTAD
jgi:DNA (cytosine-5)-methyltransferase 1